MDTLTLTFPAVPTDPIVFDPVGPYEAPLVVTIDATAVVPVNVDPFDIARIEVDWGDGSPLSVIHRSPTNDPTQADIVHTYYRELSGNDDSFAVTLSAFEFSTFALSYEASANISSIGLPSMTAVDPTLVGSRSMGSNGDVLLMFESSLAQLLPVMVSSNETTTSVTNQSTCVDPSSWEDSLEVTSVAAVISGETIPVSAEYAICTYVADQGRSSDVDYIPLMDAILAVDPDYYLFGGGGNNPNGRYTTIISNWSKMSAKIAAEVVLPALGTAELKGMTISDTIVSQKIVLGDTWKYWDIQTTMAETTAVPWYSETYDDTAWPSAPAQFGFGDDGETTVTAGPTAFDPICSETYMVTSQAFRKDFTISSGDVATADCFRVRFKRDDGIIVYMNGIELFRDNVGDGVIVADSGASCVAGDTDESKYHTLYFDTSALNVGANTIAAQVHQHSIGTHDFAFDLELATTIASPVNLPTTHGQPHVQHFDYLPHNKRYYTQDLGGGAELFVLNSGRMREKDECLEILEPDGIGIGSVQYNWFLDQIESSTAKWKIVMFYHPFVGSSSEGELLPEMDWGFGSYGVDLILNGGQQVNEHLFKDKVHIVNTSVGVGDAGKWGETSVHSEWRDQGRPNGLSYVCYTTIEATPHKLTVSVIRASTSTVLHKFDIV